jgi:hypothetical protein
MCSHWGRTDPERGQQMAPRTRPSVSRGEGSSARGNGTTVVTSVITTKRTVETTYAEVDLRQRLGLPVSARLLITVDYEQYEIDDIGGLVVIQEETFTETKEE